MMTTLDDLRRFTIARNFPAPTTLKRALHRMGFVQADPIRAPARAQDLILRHRVKHYRAGDLERDYATLDIEEDFFVIYGFVTKSLQALMHPRSDEEGRIKEEGKREKAKTSTTQQLLEFVRDRGEVHPRDLDEHFAHGKVTNFWGGSSNATTHLLDTMHYQGLLRVARREKGIRIYSPQHHEPGPTDAGQYREWSNARLDALVDVAVRLYAPLPAPSLTEMVSRIQYAAPQWRTELKEALQRARERLSQARVDGIDWFWPANEKARGVTEDRVRLLAPFDPVVRDRARFERLWGWEYRFEAYTPAAKRKLGYYALPLLWRARVIGWGNISVKDGELRTEFGYIESQPRDRAFRRELDAELDRLRVFLGVES